MKICRLAVLVSGVALAGVLGLGVALPALSQESGAWAAKAPMPAIRNEVAAASVNGKLYVFGGSVGGGRYDLTRNEEYDPAGNTWRVRKDLPSGANHMTAVASNGKIYVVGGFLGSQHRDAVAGAYEYDPAADGSRFLIRQVIDPPAQPIVVVLDWTARLRQR